MALLKGCLLIFEGGLDILLSFWNWSPGYIRLLIRCSVVKSTEEILDSLVYLGDVGYSLRYFLL